jgi:hypothetical protein
MSQLSENHLNHILEEAMSSLFPGLTNSDTVIDYYSYTEPMPDLIPITPDTDISNTQMNTQMNTQISHIQLLNNISESYQQNILQYQQNMNSIIAILNRGMERRVIETYIDIPIYRRDISNSTVRTRRERNTIPTPFQVFQATDTFVYSNTVLNNHVCPISLEAFREGEIICRIKHCDHIFKQLEIIKWFSRNSLCPVCRHDICA